MTFNWNFEKNQILIKQRNISFETIEKYIIDDCLVDILINNKKKEYEHQIIMLVLIDDYIWEVPSVITQNDPMVIFLITAFPSRKENKKYWRNKNEN